MFSSLFVFMCLFTNSFQFLFFPRKNKVPPLVGNTTQTKNISKTKDLFEINFNNQLLNLDVLGEKKGSDLNDLCLGGNAKCFQTSLDRLLWKKQRRISNKVSCPNGIYDSFTNRCRKISKDRIRINVERTLDAAFSEDNEFSMPLFKTPSYKKETESSRFLSKILCEPNHVYDESIQKCRKSSIHEISPINPHKYSNRSAVVLKNTSQLMQTSRLSVIQSQATRQHQGYHCVGKWLIVKEGHFTVLQNKSITLQIDPTKSFHFESYVWQNTSVAICVNATQLGITISNCTGTLVLMEEGEFTVLENNSIYVNASRRIYDLLRYTWHNHSLYICDHFPKIELNYRRKSESDEVLAILSDVCMLLSIAALIFVLVTYSLFSELRTPPGINVMNLSLSILLAQLLWILGSHQTEQPMVCILVAVLLHYFFMVSFLWTSIITFDTWKAFNANSTPSFGRSKRSHFLQTVRYVAIALLTVAIYIAICITIDQYGIMPIRYGSEYPCWIANNNAKIYFFGIPVGLVMIFNIVFYTMTVIAIRNTRTDTKLIATQSAKKNEFAIYVKIGSLMGFTWIFGFAAPYGGRVLSYIFVLLNSLQGVYIAIAFALSGRARKLYCDMFREKYIPCRKKKDIQTRRAAKSGISPTHVVSKNESTVETVLKSSDPENIV